MSILDMLCTMECFKFSNLNNKFEPSWKLIESIWYRRIFLFIKQLIILIHYILSITLILYLWFDERYSNESNEIQFAFFMAILILFGTHLFNICWKISKKVSYSIYHICCNNGLVLALKYIPFEPYNMAHILPFQVVNIFIILTYHNSEGEIFDKNIIIFSVIMFSLFIIYFVDVIYNMAYIEIMVLSTLIIEKVYVPFESGFARLWFYSMLLNGTAILLIAFFWNYFHLYSLFDIIFLVLFTCLNISLMRTIQMFNSDNHPYDPTKGANSFYYLYKEFFFENINTNNDIFDCMFLYIHYYNHEKKKKHKWCSSECIQQQQTYFALNNLRRIQRVNEMINRLQFVSKCNKNKKMKMYLYVIMEIFGSLFPMYWFVRFWRNTQFKFNNYLNIFLLTLCFIYFISFVSFHFYFFIWRILGYYWERLHFLQLHNKRLQKNYIEMRKVNNIDKCLQSFICVDSIRYEIISFNWQW
eukprot:459355_1